MLPNSNRKQHEDNVEVGFLAIDGHREERCDSLLYRRICT